MEGTGKKKTSFFARFFSGTEAKRESRPKTIIKIKTVGDIPPIVETRKLLGEGRVREAIMNAYQFAKQDYVRFYNIHLSKSETNRQFIMRSLKELGVNIPENGFVDSHAISDGMNAFVPIKETSLDRFNALRKLTGFYLDYYEKTRFGETWNPDPDTVIEKLEDIYNYLDIMKLYYAEVQRNDDFGLGMNRNTSSPMDEGQPSEEDQGTG